MKLRTAQVGVLLIGLLCLTNVQADEATAPIGYVKTISGEASVTTGGNKVAASLGTPLYLGSQLKTGHTGSLGVTFKDDTLMSFGPDTELTVDKYLYAPNEDQFQLVASMLRGSLNYMSGLIAKMRPESVSVKTPTSIIGVRGTHFVVKVDEPVL